MTARPEMRLSFLGGASEIGASCTLVEVGDTCLLVDTGIRPGARESLPDLSQLDGKPLDAILVTHAHMDHTGALPVVCESFPGVPVFASPPTIELVTILLRDALKLMNSPDWEGEVPLYAAHQVDRVLESFRPLHHGESRTVGSVEVRFLPAAHILGASMIHLATPAGAVLFTGDFSVSAQHTVPALTRPSVHADLVVCEATYGRRLHEDRSQAEERLISQIQTVVEGGGRVLIPAFAVGRAQEILLILKRAFRRGRIPEIPVYVDGMVRTVCGIYGNHGRYVTRSLQHEIRKAAQPFYTNGIEPVRNAEDRKRILAREEPCVFVASSGMLTGGPSLAYAQELAGQGKDAILLTGYQDEESPGRRFLELADKQGTQDLKLGDREVEVCCRVELYGLSAHADRLQILGLLEALDPRTVVLVHGDPAARQSLAAGVRCPDTLVVENGQLVVRTYSVRRNRPQTGSRVDVCTLDTQWIRSVLGPSDIGPLRAYQLARTLLGPGVQAAEVDLLVQHLEALNLVRRDDVRRGLLWVQAPDAGAGGADEAALEEVLKQENPKGRLLELCMRSRVPMPTVASRVVGAHHEVVMSLVYHDHPMESSPHRASSKKTAEQMAARDLLEKIGAGTCDGREVVQVVDAEALKAENPKGSLLEWCIQKRMPQPAFEQRVTPEGFLVRALLTISGSIPMTSGWYQAGTARAGEQAAARELLGQLEQGLSAPPSNPAATGSEDPPPEAPLQDRDGRIELNELRQRKQIEAFGYEVLQSGGPSHQPVFLVCAWARTSDGMKHVSRGAEANSKKAAQREAAGLLVAKLEAQGIALF